MKEVGCICKVCVPSIVIISLYSGTSNFSTKSVNIGMLIKSYHIHSSSEEIERDTVSYFKFCFIIINRHFPIISLGHSQA